MTWVRRRVRPEQVRELSLLLLIVLAVLAFSSLIEGYYTPRTFVRISTSVAVIAVAAVGQTLVMLTRNIDLSVGSVVGCTAYVAGSLLGLAVVDTYPGLKLIVAPTVVGITAASKAVQDEGFCGKIKVTGIGIPKRWCPTR